MSDRVRLQLLSNGGDVILFANIANARRSFSEFCITLNIEQFNINKIS